MKKTIWKSIKDSIRNSNEWLFWFTTLWTLIYIAVFWVEFMTMGKFIVSYETTIIYLGFLGTYAATKEIGKWCGQLINIDRPGELLIYIWGITAIIMFLIKFFHPEFTFPPELRRVILGVLAIFATSGISKTIRSKYDKKQKP